MGEKFTYEVRPQIPIRNVFFGKVLVRPTVIDLNKEEVRECLKFGPVYRRFDGLHTERVNINNIDELHRQFFDVKKSVKVEKK